MCVTALRTGRLSKVRRRLPFGLSDFFPFGYDGLFDAGAAGDRPGQNEVTPADRNLAGVVIWLPVRTAMR